MGIVTLKNKSQLKIPSKCPYAERILNEFESDENNRKSNRNKELYNNLLNNDNNNDNSNNYDHEDIKNYQTSHDKSFLNTSFNKFN